MSDGLHLQGAQHCLGFNRIQAWLTHNYHESHDAFTLVVTTDALMTADLMPKGVLQTDSYTGTKDLSNAGGIVMPMQDPGKSYDGTKALQQPHCLEHSVYHLDHAFAVCPSVVHHQCTYFSHVNVQSRSPGDEGCIMRRIFCMPASMQHDAIHVALPKKSLVLWPPHTEDGPRACKLAFHVHSPPLLTRYTICISHYDAWQ